MSPVRQQFLTGVVCAMLAGAVPSQAHARERVNPFARPVSVVPAAGGDAVTASSEQPALTLKAVLPSGRVPMANINGEILAVGDVYAGYELVAVDVDAVTLRLGEHAIDLYLIPAPLSAQGREDDG